VKVLIKKAAYDYGTLRPLVFEMMNALGGDLIENHSRVVIKPNLLVPAKPGQAVLTHPLIVRAAAEYVLERGAHPRICDSPAMGSFDRLLRESGIREAIRGLDVTCKPFRDSTHVDIGEPFGRIEVAEEAVDADFLINLPKLKTHSQMLLTLGVKNLFGCVVGFRKAEWHLRTGVNRDLFARLLVQIHQTLKPFMTILDGILALEGDGPGKGGTPKKLGLLLASNNTLALDDTVCRLLGLPPERLPTNKAAREMGHFNPDFRVLGDVEKIDGFKLPGAASLITGPRPLHGFLRGILLSRPVPDDRLCNLCGECWKFCPAGAITEEQKTLRFDYDKCIRCYCCIEVCPQGALRVRETLPGKLVRKLVHEPR